MTKQSRLCVALVVPMLFAISIAPAVGACGQGKTPTYSDIYAIRYERTNCFGKCASYEVLFTNNLDCYYVGYEYVAKRGTYKSVCTAGVLKRASAVLEAHDFFALNYNSSVLVTDLPHYVVAVERCGVTTMLNWPARGDRKDIESLFDGLDKITAEVGWQKASNSAEPPLPLLAPIPTPI